MTIQERQVRPSGEVQGVDSFLRALVAPDAAALGVWATSARPDARWADWLLHHQLVSFAFYRLRQADVLARLPAEFSGALRGMYYNAAAAAVLHTSELTGILDALGAAGIIPILFKGAVLAHTVYPDPACRPMGDLDLWLAHEEMAPAQAALENLGYVQRIKSTRPLEMQPQRGGEIQLVGTRHGSGLVELHWGVFPGEWLHRAAAADDGGIRGRAVSVTIAGRPALTLAPEDAIIQLATHLAVSHQMAAPGLRGLLDVVLLARLQPIDWQAVAERARGWRVAVATWLVLDLADALFGLPEAEAAIARLRPHRIRRGFLGRFVDADSMLAGRDMTHGPLRFAYQLLLVDRAQDAARLLGRALWPEGDWLTMRYGRQDAPTRWRHLLDAARGKI